MQQQLDNTSRQALEQELDDIGTFTKRYTEDVPYTKQYFTIGRQAHVRSTQSFGTPALVWHVAFWPKRELDPQNLNGSVPDAAPGQDATTVSRDDARERYQKRRAELVADINQYLLRKLQEKGRIKGCAEERRELFEEPTAPVDWETGGAGLEAPVKALPTESISFTIWWHDESRERCPDQPPEGDLRVRVQANIHPDFAAITFIIDAGKPWNTPSYCVGTGAPAYAKGDEEMDEDALALLREDVPGSRRRRIFRAARIIRHMASERLASEKAAEQDILPERDITEPAARKLRWASKLLYLDIWNEFCQTFDCGLAAIAGDTDKVFANFRGVVLCAPGGEPEPGEPEPHLSRFVYGSQSGRGSLDRPYPHHVVKAYWPFIRRTRSEADHRDWIACGVFDWRALYITALGGQSELDPNDEGDPDTDVPSGHLPKHKRDPKEVIAAIANRERLAELLSVHKSDAAIADRIGKLNDALDFPSTPRGDHPRPFHYLFLTSGEPDRRQIGRMVDRVNLLGTVRLYAMKNFSIIRDADVHLRIYGQLLDQIMSKATRDIEVEQHEWWGGEFPRTLKRLQALPPSSWPARHEQKYKECLAELRQENDKLDAWEKAGKAGELLLSEKPLLLYRRLLDAIIRDKQADHSLLERAREDLEAARNAKSQHDEDLGQLNRETDLSLTRLKTYVDELGRDAIGGLAFRINRARFYADMYRTMVKTLRVGSIDTWWDYEQLASRGVDPPLKFIENVGDRLEKLRVRLRDAMEAVQTSAIANQTEATRDNTYQLEVIATEMRNVVVRVGSLIEKTENVRLELHSQRRKNEEVLTAIRELQRQAAETDKSSASVRRAAENVRFAQFVLNALTSPGFWAFLMFVVFCLGWLFRPS